MHAGACRHARRDGTIALAFHAPRGNELVPLLALRPSGATAWTRRIHAEGREGYGPHRLHFAADGALVVHLLDRLHRLAPGATALEELPVAGLPEGRAGASSVLLTDGSLVAIPEQGAPYRLEAGADSWTPLPQQEGLLRVEQAPDGGLLGLSRRGGTWRLAPGDEAWKMVGPEVPWLTTARATIAGSDGTLWMASGRGVLLFDDGAWRPVGAGLCSFGVSPHLALADDGTAYCAVGRFLFRLDEDEVWVPVQGIAPGAPIAGLRTMPGGRIWVEYGPGPILELRLD